jgi:hypothetical protein
MKLRTITRASCKHDEEDVKAGSWEKEILDYGEKTGEIHKHIL